MAHGYVAGINQYLEDTGINNLPGECAGQDWVQEDRRQHLLVAYTLSTFQCWPALRNFIDAD